MDDHRTPSNPVPPQLSLEDLWRDVLDKCRGIINNEEDFEVIAGFQDHECVVTYLQNIVKSRERSPIASRLRTFCSQLTTLRAFVTALFVGLGGGANLSAACFFGELASKSEQTLAEIIDILNELGHRLKVFYVYRRSLDLDQETLQAFFDILVELTLNIASAIKHFRRHNIKDVLSGNANWAILSARFRTNLKTLQVELDQLQKLVEAKNSARWNRSQAELIRRLDELSLQSLSRTVRSMRCHTIPYPQNPGFFGRIDVLDEISASFTEQASRVGSVALWGTGGIGKTQVALEYAHRLWSEGEEVILWIASETPAEVSKSFSDAARELRLEDYSESNTPDKTRHLVLQWLQYTDMSWTVIFDNVESHDALFRNWPTVGRGKILVTCRSELLADSERITKSIEVPAFTVDQTTEMILQMLNKKSPADKEVVATNQLSTQLGGLALAIDIIAKQMKISRRFGSVAEFLPYFEKNQKTALKRPMRGGADPWYSKDLDNVWQTAFDNLIEDAAELLGLLCFMSPESIPLSLFQGDGWKELRLEWDLLKNLERQVTLLWFVVRVADTVENRFEEAENELIDSSLVRINTKTSVIAVHRLIQGGYLDQMSADARVESFEGALALLWARYPRRYGTRHLKHRYESVKALQGFFTTGDSYAELIRDNAWYMIEIQHFLEAEDLLLSLLDDIEADAVSKDNDLANAYSNVGYAMVSAHNADEGIKHLDTAVSMAKSQREPESYEAYNVDRFLRNRGRAKQQLRRFQEALQDFDEAERFQEKLHGPNSHYDGETKHERSKIAAWLGKLDEAYKLSLEAEELVSVGKPTHASVMATQYRQGWVALLQNKDEAALQHFQKALVICHLNEPHRGNAGEAARVQWRLSHIYERKGMAAEASTAREEARRVKEELLATGNYAVVEDEDASWDALVGLLYR